MCTPRTTVGQFHVVLAIADGAIERGAFDIVDIVLRPIDAGLADFFKDEPQAFLMTVTRAAQAAYHEAKRTQIAELVTQLCASGRS
jgi:hypothetical protein